MIEHTFVADAKEIDIEIGKKEYTRHDRTDLTDFVVHFRSKERGIKVTQWGGRSAFISRSLLDSGRLDAKYYFMRLYVGRIKSSGPKVKKLSEIATISQPKILPSKNPEREFFYLEVPDISEGRER